MLEADVRYCRCLRSAGNAADRSLLLAMAGELRHRGPDGTGLYLDGRFGMANTRLAIVDLAGGDQPLSDESGRYWVMQNGEIYNYVELRAELEQLGHRFATTSDTEVIAHAYEEWGVGCLARLNGDFAIAIWDREPGELLLARDRFGVRPLFLAEYDGDVCFASEAQGAASPPCSPARARPGRRSSTPSRRGRRSRTAPRSWGSASSRRRTTSSSGPDGMGPETRWWDIDFAPGRGSRGRADRRGRGAARSTRSAFACARTCLSATYLSGGLDSSAIAAIAARQVGEDTPVRVRGRLQRRALRRERFAGRDRRRARRRLPPDDRRRCRRSRKCSRASSSSPRSRCCGPRRRRCSVLSGAVQEAGLKVVLTGEAADELFGGYDIFREDKVRRFWARDPSSQLRPLLFRRLNRWLATDPARAGAFLARFYARDLSRPSTIRSTATGSASRTRRAVCGCSAGAAPEAQPEGRLGRRGCCAAAGALRATSRRSRKAQYLEIATFFEGYLLHSQGDRMLMGHSIEGRFPFVDVRLAELAARLPDSLRLRGLQEKYALRRAVARLPRRRRSARVRRFRIARRSARSSSAASDPTTRLELLRAQRVEDAGLLDPAAVGRLVAQVRGRRGAASARRTRWRSSARSR